MNGAGGDFLFPWVLSRNALIPAQKRAVPLPGFCTHKGTGKSSPNWGQWKNLAPETYFLKCPQTACLAAQRLSETMRFSSFSAGNGLCCVKKSWLRFFLHPLISWENGTFLWLQERSGWLLLWGWVSKKTDSADGACAINFFGTNRNAAPIAGSGVVFWNFSGEVNHPAEREKASAYTTGIMA